MPRKKLTWRREADEYTSSVALSSHGTRGNQLNAPLASIGSVHLGLGVMVSKHLHSSATTTSSIEQQTESGKWERRKGRRSGGGRRRAPCWLTGCQRICVMARASAAGKRHASSHRLPCPPDGDKNWQVTNDAWSESGRRVVSPRHPACPQDTSTTPARRPPCSVGTPS